MSHRINLDEAKHKLEHELEVQTLNKKGDYRSTRFEKRKQKRLQHETSWFEYIKGRGGIKEKKEKNDVSEISEETELDQKSGKEMQ